MTRELGALAAPPLYRPWDPDDSIDFHAARLLVLLRRCGEGSRYHIEGRTKLAKLDFFLRYPAFLERARAAVRATGRDIAPWRADGAEVEAPMIRYRYGTLGSSVPAVPGVPGSQAADTHHSDPTRTCLLNRGRTTTC